jgi:hypothetical protein
MPHSKEESMRGATILVAAAGAVTMMVATMSPAKAWYDQWGRWHPDHHWHNGYAYAPPPPVYYRPPPAYYRPPPPAYYGPPGVSIGVRIP